MPAALPTRPGTCNQSSAEFDAGEDISTRAMMDYFKPLMSWLEEQNKGRQIGWD
jgi:Angiotensin-converting enzyme